MSDNSEARKPRAFDADDPELVPAEPEDTGMPGPPGARPDAGRIGLPSRADAARGFRWGVLLVSTMSLLAGLAATLSFARFISIALERQDWIGWLAFGLLALGLLAAAVLAARELVGMVRLRRIGRLRRDAEAALARRDARLERATARRLQALYADRPDTAWSLARYREHLKDVHDPGALLALADRELIAPLDREARRIALASAKRVTTVTAIAPMALLSVGFVAIECLRMLRALAALYGGRPGFFGALRLAGNVVGHMVATGGIALTDDLLGQFLGQDVLRRLSRRLGEAAFNGALTARVGAAAIQIVRPLPFIEAPRVRARDIAKELLRKSPDKVDA